MTNNKFHKLFGQDPRNPENEKSLNFIWIFLHQFKK